MFPKSTQKPPSILFYFSIKRLSFFQSVCLVLMSNLEEQLLFPLNSKAQYVSTAEMESFLQKHAFPKCVKKDKSM